jgi:hypothetical protein
VRVLTTLIEQNSWYVLVELRKEAVTLESYDKAKKLKDHIQTSKNENLNENQEMFNLPLHKFRSRVATFRQPG